MIFKETVGFRVDVAGSSSATKNSTGEINKSKGVCSSVGSNNRAPGHHKIASPTSKAAINLATSGATGSGRSLYENPLLKHVFDTLEVILHKQPGESNDFVMKQVPLEESQP